MGSETLNTTNSTGIILSASGAYESPFTITTAGTVSTSGYGVYSNLSGAYLLDQGSIASSGEDAIRFANGGTITNAVSGIVTGGADGADLRGDGIVFNAGTLTGNAGDGVYLGGEGALTNSASGLISGSVNGLNDPNTWVRVYNSGTITGGSGDGVFMVHGGILYNNVTTAVIRGGKDGVELQGSGSDANIVNDGTIAGTAGDGVYLGGAGILTNSASGVISGGVDGVDDSNTWIRVYNTGTITGSAKYGVYLIDQSTVVNSGTIEGGVAAIDINGTGDALVVADPGAVFIGKVEATGADNTLELGSGTGSGTLSGLGTSFTGFSQIKVDSGANWALHGANTVAAGTTLTDDGNLSATSLENNGTILIDSGTLTLNGNLTGTGMTTIGADATLAVNGNIEAGETIVLDGPGATLKLTNTAYSPSPAGSAYIDGTVGGAGTIDITTVPYSDVLEAGFAIQPDIYIFYRPGDDILIIPENVTGNETASDQSDGASGTDVVLTAMPCFAAGTRIHTARGDIRVEDLVAGDTVTTQLPGGPASRKIIWIGHRLVDCTRHPNPETVWPILIRAGAFGEARPARDLYVSPRHAIFFEGVLIQAEQLINGATVLQQRCDQVDYWHVELDAHDILLAENLPAESYLDNGNRTAFEGGGDYLELHPDFAPKHWMDTCAPLVFDGARLQAARRLLLARAQTLGHEITAAEDLHVIADGKRIESINLSASRRAFVLPAGCADIRLNSRSFVPAQHDPQSDDQRRLGVCAGSLQLDGTDIALDDEGMFATGWHALERPVEGGVQRWTTGNTPIPANTQLIVIELLGRGYYWATRRNDEALERDDIQPNRKISRLRSR